MFSDEQMARKSKKEVDSSTEQIREKRTEIKYDTRDYVVEHIVKKFSDDEFYIDPEYQRNFVWNEKDKCFFIESLLMGLPIPLMFFADTDDGRIEIVDGAQRTQTLVQFVENELELANLRVLTESNGFRFQDLELPVQRRFLNSRIRVVFLEEGTTVDTRQEIFRRINTGGLGIVPSEIRRGALDGPFSEFLTKCTKNDLFNKLAPRTEKTEKRFEGLELVSRFFAYLNNYDNGYESYTGQVQQYIDEYVENENARFEAGNTEQLVSEYVAVFESMLEFAQELLGELGFRKKVSSKSTPRARFEALAVGMALALRENPSLKASDPDWLNSEEFNVHTKSDAANNKSRLVGRIEYVRDQLLSNSDSDD